VAENHYVDAKDQHIAAEGVADHSDLTTFYAEAKKEELGPWMQEADRQKVLEEERNKVVLGLRKSAVLVGLSISLTVVAGIALGQFFMNFITIENATYALPVIILGLLGFIALTFLLLRWVTRTFNTHNLRALPITLTTLLSLLFVSRPLFETMNSLVGGIAGYVAALASLVVIGIIIAAVSIFIWTSQKIHGIAKILILALFFGAAVAAAYLI